jgi:hypothetical protein
MDNKAPMSFIQAMKDYFGVRPGETAMDFMAEIKALTDVDRAYFRKHLPSVGYVLA